VHLAVVQVDVEAPVRRQNTVRLDETRFQERQVVVEEIGEALLPYNNTLVAMPLEADTVAAAQSAPS
jgi:hypothetical protein